MTNKKPFYVLGIESSCDETSIAVLLDGDVISCKVFTQVEHSKFGGVVPEIASRAHIQKIEHLYKDVLEKSNVTIDDINLIAVTDRPGLAGALLVGISFALGLHSRYGIPITGVNHLEGHIAAATIENPDLTFPFIALVVSGGHTALYEANDFGSYKCLGRTIDDAAGEAFDKVGKLLGFAYPAGRAIEETARTATEDIGQRYPVAKVKGKELAFSFSGLKTSVKYSLQNKTPEYIEKYKASICKNFQDAVIESLVRNTVLASKKTGLNKITLVGGVASNGAIRDALQKALGTKIFFPSPKYCVDNAAMIAKAGFEIYKRNLLRFPSMNPSSDL